MQAFAHLDISELFFEEGNGHIVISYQALCLYLQVGSGIRSIAQLSWQLWLTWCNGPSWFACLRIDLLGDLSHHRLQCGGIQLNEVRDRPCRLCHILDRHGGLHACYTRTGLDSQARIGHGV